MVKIKLEEKKTSRNFDHVCHVGSMLFEDSTIPLVSTSLVSMQAKALL